MTFKIFIRKGKPGEIYNFLIQFSFRRISPKWDVTNALLVATLVGTGTYIYTRKHMQNAPACSRICYRY